MACRCSQAVSREVCREAAADAGLAFDRKASAHRFGQAARFERAEDAQPRAWVSARDGIGLDALREGLAQLFGMRRIVTTLELPSDAARLRSQLHELGAIRAETHDEAGWRLDIDLPESDARRLLGEPHAAGLRALLPEGGTDPI